MPSESEQEARLYCQQDMDQAQSHSLAGGTAAVFSARCPGKETPNEDAAALIPCCAESGILVVADGLGGMAAGEQAATLAVDAIKEAVQQEQMLRTGILNGFENANRIVQDMGVGAATTLAVIEMDRGEVRPYHVGDSMILVVGGRGKIKMQTVSHSPVGYAVEAGMLDEAEAMHHEDRHLVSNVIGMPEMRIEIGPTLRLAPRDTLLLASDGLFDNLHVEEIVQRVRKGPLSCAMQRLAEDALQRMNQPADGHPSKPDDLTFVVYRGPRGAKEVSR